MIIPLMSRIFKQRADVKRAFSDFGKNFLAGEVRDLDSRYPLSRARASRE
jgi:hypothetical protein